MRNRAFGPGSLFVDVDRRRVLSTASEEENRCSFLPASRYRLAAEHQGRAKPIDLVRRPGRRSPARRSPTRVEDRRSGSRSNRELRRRDQGERRSACRRIVRAYQKQACRRPPTPADDPRSTTRTACRVDRGRHVRARRLVHGEREADLHARMSLQRAERRQDVGRQCGGDAQIVFDNRTGDDNWRPAACDAVRARHRASSPSPQSTPGLVE